jgi:hypothetical protein
MISETKSRRSKPTRGRPEQKGTPKEMNQATGAEFEREGMGVAPKE